MMPGRGRLLSLGVISAALVAPAIYWLNMRSAADAGEHALIDALATAPICKPGRNARGTAQFPQSHAAGFVLAAAQSTSAAPGGHAHDMSVRPPAQASDPAARSNMGHDHHDHRDMAMPKPASADEPAIKPKAEHRHGDHHQTAMQAPPTAPAKRGKILYYRNPMGLPDISQVPKKDSMGMDYVPVYEGETSADGASLQIPLGRLQRAGVRTEAVSKRMLAVEIRGPGTIGYDDRRVTSVTPGVDGYADNVYVPHVGVTVKAGDPLVRIGTNNVQMLQIEIARRKGHAARAESGGQGLFTGNLGSSTVTGSLVAADWPSPVSGLVVDKKIINGQRIGMNDEIFRIADVSRMWVVADIAETSLAMVKRGMPASIRPRAFPGVAMNGNVLFIFPRLNGETRTARVCIEVPNADGRLQAEMYADIVIEAQHMQQPVLAVPVSAIIDDGMNEHVLVGHDGGRFEPRRVRTGLRTPEYVEVVAGLTDGERVVTSAASLIDAESRLKSALDAFAAAAKP